MQAALPSPTHERRTSAVDDDAVQHREPTYTTVDWDYPASPTAYHHALLSRGASHSRFLRIAYLSTRERVCTFSDTSTTATTPSRSSRTSAIHLLPPPPYLLSRHPVPLPLRSANPPSHTLKRRKPLSLKPPHYHASLLRSPLSRRKGLFRAVLPPSKAVDFFRWDVLVHSRVSLPAPYPARDRTRIADVYAFPPCHVAESVLEPYEAATGFFGWLGLDVIRRFERREKVELLGLEHDYARRGNAFDLRLEIDEAKVDEGKARWARTAEELVGPPGVASRWVVENGQSAKVAPPLDPAHKNHEVRWDPDIRFTSCRPSRPNATSDEGQSLVFVSASAPSPKVEPKSDAASVWWHVPSQRGPLPANHLPSLRFPPPPSVQYGPPPIQFSPWFSGSRVASAHGHGYWYGAPPTGAPPSVNRDSNHTNSLASPSHGFHHVTSTSIHPPQSPRQYTKSFLGRDERELSPDRDRETEDHDYESATATTDSDPPPHTPIGAATTSHCVEALQVHGDDEVSVDNIEIDEARAAAAVAIGMSDPTTPVKLLDRFSVSASPSVSSSSSDSYRDGFQSSKAAVVFPSLNGSFRQGSLSQLSISLSSQVMSAQTTPARMVTPASSVSLSGKESTARLSLGDLEVNIKGGNSDSSASDGPGLSSPPPTSPSGVLRKDSRGFWEPLNPISPSSSSSSLPLSPTEGKMGSRITAAGWLGEKTVLVPGQCVTPSPKARLLSPGPRRVDSADSTPSSLRAGSLSPPASGPTDSHPSSPSPSGVSEALANPTTLLPAFLTTTTVKRKKTSRTREIVDQLRSGSVDAGKSGMELESLGWQAGASVNGGMDNAVGKVSSVSEHPAVNHVTGGKPPPSPPSKAGADGTPGVESDLAKTQQGQATNAKSSGPGSSASEGKSSGATSGPDTHSSHSSKSKITSTNSGIKPFPILTMSQPSSARGQTAVTAGPLTSSNVGDGPKLTIMTSPIARSSGLPHLVNTPNCGTSPTSHAHYLHPSPTRSVVHGLPPLGPPPAIIAVSPYPPPMYVPFTQYRLGPLPHQGPQGQGWVPIYPGRPPLPVHPLPTQSHVQPITGVSGMRHASW